MTQPDQVESKKQLHATEGRGRGVLAIAWLVFAGLGVFMLFFVGGTLALAAASLGIWGAMNSLMQWQEEKIATGNSEALGRFYLFGQWVRLAVGVGFLITPWLFFLAGPVAAESIAVVQTVGIVWLLLAGAGYFLFFQLRAAVAGHEGDDFSRRGGLLILLSIGAVGIGAGLLGAVFWEREIATWVAWVLLGLLAFLLVETFLRSVFFWFAPRRLREKGPLVCESLVLRWMVPGSGVVREFLGRFEELTGTRLQEIHALRFLGRSLLPAAGLVLILVWLSTAVSIVPFGYEGVRSVFGKYSAQSLGPGLHFGLPWPFGTIEVVHSGLVRQESVGFATDLLGPVLWNEKHLEGEENFLLGGGDEMLTINLPIFYRVSDPVNFLVGTRNIGEALRGMAQRELLLAMAGKPVFALISEERAMLMDAVQRGLQRECERLGLGVEIVFVGLKDMHPPVQVAAAYQAVSAAEDEQAALLERAQAFRVDQLAGATEEAFRLKRLADLRAAERVLAMEGEVSVLRALSAQDIAVRGENPAVAGLLRYRLWQEVLAEKLPGKEKFLLPTKNGNGEGERGAGASLLIDYRGEGTGGAFP